MSCVRSCYKENKLLKRVLNEKWAKEQIEQQLNKMTGTELMDLLDDGLALKIFKSEKPEAPKLEIFKLEIPSVDVIGQDGLLPSKISDKELKLVESGRLYLCDYVGIGRLDDCALTQLYQEIIKMLETERALKGELKGIERKRKLKARGVKFFLFVVPCTPDGKPVNRPVPREEHPNWFNLLVDRLPIFFGDTRIYYDSSIEDKLIAIKVFCPNAQFKLRPSEAGEFYGKLCDNYIIFASKSLAKNNFKLVGYRFDLVFRMNPPEEPNEFIPMDIAIPEPKTLEKQLQFAPNLISSKEQPQLAPAPKTMKEKITGAIYDVFPKVRRKKGK